MKGSPCRWPMKLLGFVVLVIVSSGCATSNSSCEPAKYERFSDSEVRLDEYGTLVELNLAPSLRAWIREADRVIDANNAYGGAPE